MNIESVRFEMPDSRTTRMAAATASLTEPSGSSVVDGATEKATSMMISSKVMGTMQSGSHVGHRARRATSVASWARQDQLAQASGSQVPVTTASSQW